MELRAAKANAKKGGLGPIKNEPRYKAESKAPPVQQPQKMYRLEVSSLIDDNFGKIFLEIDRPVMEEFIIQKRTALSNLFACVNEQMFKGGEINYKFLVDNCVCLVQPLKEPTGQNYLARYANDISDKKDDMVCLLFNGHKLAEVVPKKSIQMFCMIFKNDYLTRKLPTPAAIIKIERPSNIPCVSRDCLYYVPNFNVKEECSSEDKQVD